MKILAMEKEMPGRQPDQFTRQLKSEALHVWSLYQSGFLREIYFRQDCSNAVLIVECDTAEEARQLLDTLPLVQAGLISFDIIPLIPYPGFARLFASS